MDSGNIKLIYDLVVLQSQWCDLLFSEYLKPKTRRPTKLFSKVVKLRIQIQFKYRNVASSFSSLSICHFVRTYQMNARGPNQISKSSLEVTRNPRFFSFQRSHFFFLAFVTKKRAFCEVVIAQYPKLTVSCLCTHIRRFSVKDELPPPDFFALVRSIFPPTKLHACSFSWSKSS